MGILSPKQDGGRSVWLLNVNFEHVYFENILVLDERTAPWIWRLEYLWPKVEDSLQRRWCFVIFIRHRTFWAIIVTPNFHFHLRYYSCFCCLSGKDETQDVACTCFWLNFRIPVHFDMRLDVAPAVPQSINTCKTKQKRNPLRDCGSISSTTIKIIFRFYTLMINVMEISVTDLPTPVTCKSGGFEKQAQKNLEIRTSFWDFKNVCQIKTTDY